MGMYTGLRGTIIFNQEIATLIEEWNDVVTGEDIWEYVYNRTELPSVFGVFAKDTRSSFIPCGALCYMPDEWEELGGWCLDGSTMTFACSLKNYNGTIQKFLNALPCIATAWDLEELYEESEIPTAHKKENK